MECFALLPIVLLIAFLIFWGHEFVELMLLSDSDFPGKYDKILWVLAFLVMFFVAPFAFVFWKQAYIEMRNVPKNENTNENKQVE